MKFFTLGSTRTSSDNTYYSGAVLDPTVLKTRYRSKIGSLLVLMIFGLAMLMPAKMNAQVPPTLEDYFDLPDPDRCTSEDLDILTASLALDNCNCVEGEISYVNLELGVINRTSSERTSFAFWSRLTTTDPETNEEVVYFINGCTGPILPSQTLVYEFGENAAGTLFISDIEGNIVNYPGTLDPLLQIPYVCGTTLELTNIYEAWTDASDNTPRQCPLDSSKINPKCDVLPTITVNVGLAASSEFTDVNCNDDNGTSDDGSVTLTFSGGTSPYLISFNGGAFTAQSSPKTYSGLAAGTYNWIVKDSANPPCQKSGSETISNPPQLIVDDPADVTRCDSYTLPALTNGNYFTGSGGTGTQLSAGDAITSTQTIYVYSETGTTPKCTAQNSFVVTINTTPVADDPADVTRCDSYTLPALSAGSKYYTGSGGTGTELLAGASITTTQDIYVYAAAIAPCIADENVFKVTINTTPVADDPADVTRCDSYTLPALSAGNKYYTGSGGTGTELLAGASITTTQDIYVYAAAIAPCVADENVFKVTINITPIADDPADVTRCDSYSLPALSAGNKYYTGSGGTGTELLAGASITTTQDIYVYAAAIAPCIADENVFKVTINNTPVADDPADVTRCDSYTLPALTAGNKYYTGSGGIGTELLAGASITTTQDIYVYFGAVAPCISDENVFKVTINTTPVADDPADVTRCDSYTLPALSAGNKYYTGSGGTGTELLAGASITTTQDIYVYAAAIAPCIADENVFKVTINTTPVADDPADVTRCDSYTLPALTAGNKYYTGSGGTGTELLAGASITTTQDIYVYFGAVAPCISDENVFKVTINTTPVADDPADVTRCDSYTLPALSAGNKYYTGSGGTGTELLAGASITTTQDIYVYAAAIAPCIADENVFKVTINTTPVADDPADVTRCDSYTLPALSAGNKYYTGSGGTGTELLAGASITTTQDIYVYAAAIAPCIADENVFKVTINTTPVADDPADVEECDNYTLPALTNGNYFTGPGGTGTALFAGNIITSTQTIYVYSPALAPCIAAENSFMVTINSCVTDEGCTLGYWKNHTDRWCATYTTCTLYNSVFTGSTLSPTLTLLEALNLKGNKAGENLARQSVAALLNICSEDVGFSSEFASISDLQTYVNAAFTSGAVNVAGSHLDQLNNAGCPLGGSRATTASTCPALKVSNTDAAGANSFSAYPVPFKETLNIKYNFDYKSNVTIQIFDMRGQLMKTAKEANASKDKVTTISADFARGSQVYIVQVKTDRETFIKQIISDK